MSAHIEGNVYIECLLCLRWDCDCEDILSKEEFERLVKESEVNG